MKIYAEGGGEGQLLQIVFRKGWSEFFKSAGLAGRLPRVVRGGDRQKTFDLFRTAVEHPDPDTLPLLLVDSEEAVQAGHTTWQHLKKRDNWDPPAGSTEDQAFLMVQVMETWLLADRAALRKYFDQHFNEKKLPNWPDLEAVSKEQIASALDSATTACKKRYAKGAVSFELLARTDASKVESACPHAERLLTVLRSL